MLARHDSRKWRWLTTLSLALITSVAAAILAVPRDYDVHAAGPSIIIYPKEAAYSPHTSIHIKGYRYAPNENVNIYWNYNGSGTGTLEVTVLTDITGIFVTSFKKPLAPTGFYTIAAIGQASHFVATATFHLLPQLYLSPLAGGPGSKLFIFGKAFGAYEIVNIYWNYIGPGTGTFLTTATGDSTGSFKTTAYIPAGSTPGLIPIAGVGQTSNAMGSYNFLLYPPTLALAPLNGSANTLLTLSAYGFKGSEKVNIFWNYGTTPVLTASTTTYGYIGPTPITVPAGSSPGNYIVKAVGQASHTTITNTFTVVAPSSSLSLTAGPVGVSTSISGQGYAPNETVNIFWNYTGPGTGIISTQVQAGSSGTISGSFTIPAGANGIYRVAAEGTGYQGNESVALYLDSTSGTLVGTATADASGNVNQNISIPADTTPGSHNLIGVDLTTGMIFFGTVPNFDPGTPSPFYALDVQTGALKWSLILPWNEYGFPSLAFQTIYVGTSREGGPGTIEALDEISGHVVWQQSANGGIWGSVAADSTANMVFTSVGNPANTVNAYNATTGALIWQYPIPNSGPDDDPGSGITVSNGLVYEDSKNGSIYAINENSGTLSWTTPIGALNNGDVSTQAVTSNGVLFVGSLDKNLYAIDAITGVILWKTATGGGIDSSPAIANGVVYVGSFDKKIYAMNANTGAILWSYTTGGLVYSSPIIVNGWLYCGSTDGKLYAFSL